MSIGAGEQRWLDGGLGALQPDARLLPILLLPWPHAVQRQASGGPGLSVPAAERVPCDLLAWGSAQRAPPVSVSMRSVVGMQEDCWQHRSLPGLAPGGGQLDAYRAAAGRKHAAVITATGALYTWGEGRGGKLGLGHDQVTVVERAWRLTRPELGGRWEQLPTEMGALLHVHLS